MIIKPVEKRLDASVAVEFKGKMAEFINDRNELIVLDLSEVRFMDSSGLGAILSSLKTLGRQGDIVISGTKETVSSVFTITRMDRVFRMRADELTLEYPDRSNAVTIRICKA